jgi:transposase
MNKNSKAYTAFCGIDISKDNFDYCLLNRDKQIISQAKLPITLDALNHLKEIATEDVNQNIIFLMESTGKYHRRVSDLLAYSGFDVCVIQPLLIKNYTEGKDLRKTKTDKKDARLIAQYAFDNYDSLLLYNPENSALKGLSRYRLQIVKDLSAAKTRYKEMMMTIFPELVAVKENFIYTKTIMYLLKECCLPEKLARKQVSTLDKLLKKCGASKLSIDGAHLKEMAKQSVGTKSNTAQFIIGSMIDTILNLMKLKCEVEEELEDQTKGMYGEELEIITSINGIGKTTALNFMIEIKDIGLYDDWKKLCAYAGNDPGIVQSGSSVNKKGSITKRGNKYLRCTLFLMASSVCRHSSRYKSYSEKKKLEGKEYKERIVAVANKLTKLIYSLLKKGELFDENYEISRYIKRAS